MTGLSCARCGLPIEHWDYHNDPDLADAEVHPECCAACAPSLTPPITERDWLTPAELDAAAGYRKVDLPTLGHGARDQESIARDQNWSAA